MSKGSIKSSVSYRHSGFVCMNDQRSLVASPVSTVSLFNVARCCVFTLMENWESTIFLSWRTNVLHAALEHFVLVWGDVGHRLALTSSAAIN